MIEAPEIFRVNTNRFETLVPGTTILAREMTQDDFQLLTEADLNVYPSNGDNSNFASTEWFKQIYQDNDLMSFGLIFEKEQEKIGTLVLTPLNKNAWIRLCEGKLKITDIKRDDLFDSSKDTEMYLHGYHIHDFRYEDQYRLQRLRDASEPSLSAFALRTAGDMLKEKYPTATVEGVSVLAVSKTGIAAGRKLGLMPYPNRHTSEFMTQSGKDRETLYVTTNFDEASEKIHIGWDVWETEFLMLTREAHEERKKTASKLTFLDYLDEGLDLYKFLPALTLFNAASQVANNRILNVR